MAEPKRIQLRRTKGWRKPEGAVVVARPTIYGNPFVVGDTVSSPRYDGDVVVTRDLAVALYRVWLDQRPGWRDQQARELVGVELCCWCPLDAACHADVLLEIANSAAGDRAE